ncbi:MAG: hypothetical protein HQK77_14910 [Desulfobacterales bacterium]|nr:hypothetical protein [Desulfobacterales bacterium]
MTKNTPTSFDTVEYKKQLLKSGFSEEQAQLQVEAMVQVIQERLAVEKTSEEIKSVIEYHIKYCFREFQSDLKMTQEGLRSTLAEMENRIKHTSSHFEDRFTIIMTITMSAYIAMVLLLIARFIFFK